MVHINIFAFALDFSVIRPVTAIRPVRFQFKAENIHDFSYGLWQFYFLLFSTVTEINLPALIRLIYHVNQFLAVFLTSRINYTKYRYIVKEGL